MTENFNPSFWRKLDTILYKPVVSYLLKYLYINCTYSLFRVYMLLLPQAVYCLVIAASLLLGLEKPENKTRSYHLKYYCHTP